NRAEGVLWSEEYSRHDPLRAEDVLRWIEFARSEGVTCIIAGGSRVWRAAGGTDGQGSSRNGAICDEGGPGLAALCPRVCGRSCRRTFVLGQRHAFGRRISRRPSRSG